MVVMRFIQEWKALWRGDPSLPLDSGRPHRPEEGRPGDPSLPPFPRTRLVAFSLVILGGELLSQLPLPQVLEHPLGTCLGGLAALLFTAMAIDVAVYGLRALGEGWRRWARLAALSVLLVGLLPISRGVTEAWRNAMDDMRAGFEAGYRDGTHLQTPPAPRKLPRTHHPLEHVATWGMTAGFAILFHRMARHREEAERQRALTSTLRDQALRAKLAPHFIFNTLNTLHAQIEADPRAAQATTERLAQLFRQVVEVADHPTIPLRQELSFVEAYLAIEQDRLGSRLRTAIDVPEELEDTPVPPLALQVLVENAVKHGVAASETGGTVAIRATRLGSTLQLCVTDSGQGAGSAPGTGTALDTLRQRLAKPEDLTLQRTAEGFRACFVWRHA